MPMAMLNIRNTADPDYNFKVEQEWMEWAMMPDKNSVDFHKFRNDYFEGLMNKCPRKIETFEKQGLIQMLKQYKELGY